MEGTGVTTLTGTRNTSASVALSVWPRLHRAFRGQQGSSDDNALAETISGLYKAELIHGRALWEIKEAVEFAMLEWVVYFKRYRVLEPVGPLPRRGKRIPANL